MAGDNLFRMIGTKDRLVDRVVNEIQRLIVEGQLEPGMKLPPERDFAEQLGVSRTVIREAVHILVTKGLLETRHGVGTVVRRVTNDQVIASLNILLQAQGISLENLHDVRSILEVEIAGLAAQQATDNDILTLNALIARMEAAMNDPETFVAGDADFHQALARMSHNPLLGVLLDSIRDLMQEVRLLVHRHPHLYQIVMPDHRCLMERVIAKDPEGARQAMREHLEHARQIQEEVLAQQDKEVRL
jgi:GntR family transcriptional repressor for pyruvate dehydrogenase complex